MDDLISRSALRKKVNERYHDPYFDICLREAPAVDAVSRKVVEQIMWERDTAMEQLKEHGIPFGGIAPDVVAVVRCKDCKWLYNGLDMYCCTKHTGLALITPDGSGFCSYGERRADDAD